jgi:hypothetical protein
MKNQKLYLLLVVIVLFSSCVKKEVANQNLDGTPTGIRDSGASLPINTTGSYLGVTLGYNNTTRGGGLPNPSASGNQIYNLPLYTATSTEADWWDNIVEEAAYSGIDYIAPVDRGYSPNFPTVDAGDPRKLANLVAAINRRGVASKFKIAIFDDCPSSWAANRNKDMGFGYTVPPLFDCGDTANYKYIYKYNIQTAFQNVPDAMRFKINNKPVIIFWAINTNAFTNFGSSHLKTILQYIRTRCQADFGFNPYIIVDKSWFDRDPTVNDPTVIDAEHSWFSMTNSWTLTTFNSVKTGALCPGFRVVQGTTNMFIDALHGATLNTGLNNTKNAGALLTLVEGFTDCAENAALFRSKDTVYYDYPNQRLNILRSYSNDPYPAVLKVEAEACDYFHDLTAGNSGNTFRLGDIDIVKTSDVGGGWHVTGAQAGEWLEWKELPMITSNNFQIRYSSTAAASVQFSVDGVALPAVSLPVSGFGTWLTEPAGTKTLTANGPHTVRLTVVSGSLSINYFTR